jgi:MFS family permease
MSLLSATFSEFPLLIRNRGFLQLWLSQIFGQTATNLLHFTLVLRTFEVTGSTFIVGVFVALVSLPPILFSAVGGVVADRYDRRVILLIINSTRIVISLALLPFQDETGMILIMVFLLTTLTEFFLPTEAAAIPALVPHEHLTGANSLFAFTLYSSFLIGYTAAGPVLQFGGPTIALIVVAVLYVGAALSTMGLPSLRSHLAVGDGILKKGAQGIRAQLADGLVFIRTHHLLPTLILEVSLLFGIERGVIALIPVIALHTLVLTPVAVSLLLILPLALGTVLGALTANRLKRNAHPLSLVHLGVMLEAGALLLIVPCADWFVRVAGDLGEPLIRHMSGATAAFIAGFGNVLVVVSTQTIIQRETEDGKRGRVFGGLLTVMNLIGLPFILLLSHLGSVISLTVLFSLLGLGLLGVAMASASIAAVHWKRREHPPGAQL